MTKTPLRRAGALGALCLVALSVPRFAAGADGDERERHDWTEEVVSCEEAMSKLARCCHDDFTLDGKACTDEDSTSTGCDGGRYRTQLKPLLDLAESQCVRGTPCDDLHRLGICHRVQVAEARSKTTTIEGAEGGTATGSTVGSLQRKAVCP